jgi:hypothetical protein
MMRAFSRAFSGLAAIKSNMAIEANGGGFVLDCFEGITICIAFGAADEMEETTRQLLEKPEEQWIALHLLFLGEEPHVIVFPTF